MGSLRESHLAAMAAIAVALVLSVLAWSGWVSYRLAVSDVRDRADDLAQLVERHALQVVTEARGLLAAADVAVARRDMGQLLSDRDLWNALRILTEAAESIEALAVFDHTGRMVLSTRSFPAPDWNGFQDPDFAQVMATDALFVGRLRASPVTGQPVFVISRRLSDGRGLVAAGVDLRRLDRVYGGVNSSGIRIAMVRADGTLLFHHPMDHEAFRRDGVVLPRPELLRTEDGGFTFPGVTAARALSNAPMVAVVGLDAAQEAGMWWSFLLSRLPVGLISTLFIVAFTSLAIRQVRRERRSNAALAELNRSLEAAVTERTGQLSQALEEQRRHAALAEAATQAKSRFLTAIGHDMRQPMQALRLYKQSLANRVADDPAMADIMERMGRAIAVSEDLLNSLMEIGRIEAGQVVITPAELPFDELASSLEGLSANGRLRVVPCRAVLWADRVVLGRIVANLVANALKHGRGGRVLVGCRRAAGGGLRLVVCDQGDGIPPDKIDAIFEEFYQLDNASRSRDKGLGLGLSIARRLAVACGYDMTVASSPRGSVFSVHFPAEAVHSWPVGGLGRGQRLQNNSTPAARRLPLSRPEADSGRSA